jgi:hypothetical protein
MNETFFTQDFETFARGLSTTDVALYAGAGLILWVLLKDRLSPVQVFIGGLVDQLKDILKLKKPTVADDVKLPEPVSAVVIKDKDKEDLFFKLVVSWKQTRELAVRSGCDKAVKVADDMFPYLSPNVCANSKKDTIL